MLVLFFVSLLRAVDLSVDASSDWYWPCHFQVVRVTPTHLLFLAPYSTHMRVSLFLSSISKWTPADLSYLLLYLQFPHSLFISSNYHEDFFEFLFYFCTIYLQQLDFEQLFFKRPVFRGSCFGWYYWQRLYFQLLLWAPCVPTVIFWITLFTTDNIFNG